MVYRPRIGVKPQEFWLPSVFRGLEAPALAGRVWTGLLGAVFGVPEPASRRLDPEAGFPFPFRTPGFGNSTSFFSLSVSLFCYKV
jgi:hypothetical protein